MHAGAVAIAVEITAVPVAVGVGAEGSRIGIGLGGGDIDGERGCANLDKTGAAGEAAHRLVVQLVELRIGDESEMLYPASHALRHAIQLPRANGAAANTAQFQIG